MEQHTLYMFNHFACVGLSNINSEFDVVVLLPQLFVTTRLKKELAEKCDFSLLLFAVKTVNVIASVELARVL